MLSIGKAYAVDIAFSLRTSFNGIKLGILINIYSGILNTAEGAEILLGDIVISIIVV